MKNVLFAGAAVYAPAASPGSAALRVKGAKWTLVP